MDARTRFRKLLDARVPGLTLTPNADLTRRTTMRMRTRAAVYAEVDNPIALAELLQLTRHLEIPAYLLGGGANTMFATSYFEGVVFSLGRGFRDLSFIGNNTLRVGAAVKLPALLKYSKECDLMGLEFMTMIPGTVGGALAGNAGAGNLGLCDFVERVYVMTRDGFVAEIGRGQFLYDYRFSELRDVIVLDVDLRLMPRDPVYAEREEESFKAKKIGQPYHLPSSGCIFKNPKDPDTGKPISAGKVIDEIGMKGYRIRSARISEDHANFFVNDGDSSGEDFLALISLVQDIVAHRRGLDLDLEVNIVGGPMNSVVLA
jgi:UDP-N-acetylmuramate dehydrogenase